MLRANDPSAHVCYRDFCQILTCISFCCAAGFWSASRLARLDEAVASQSEKAPKEHLDVYHKLLREYALAAEPYEETLHALVKKLLQKTRSEDENVKLRAANALLQLWSIEIDASLAAFTPEAMPFLVELLEVGGETQRVTKELLARMNEHVSDSEEQDGDDSDDDGDDVQSLQDSE